MTGLTSALRWRAYLLLFAGMSVVGGYVGFSKIIVASVPVFLLATIRFGLAGIMMLPWTFPRGGWSIVRAQRGNLFLESFFGNFLFSICMLSGLARTSATAAGLIMSTLPAVVAVFSLLALRESLSLRTASAIALAIAGISILTVMRSGSGGTVNPVGNLFMVGAVCCEALYVVLGKRLTSARIGPMQISAWINVLGFFLMLPFGIWQAIGFDFSAVPMLVWMLIVIYSFAASVLSTWLWLSGLRDLPASQAGVFTVALPITAATVGVVFLHESLTLAHAIAFACAFGGILLVTMPSSTQSSTSDRSIAPPN